MNQNQTLTPTSFVVAERFNSVQGEGRWSGTPMHFIRLAGCNVGHQRGSVDTGPFPLLKTGHAAARCKTYDGREFWCDTDYFHGLVMTFELLANMTTERHVVFTGGEPMLHQDKLVDFMNTYPQFDYHIETSGTIMVKPDLAARGVWITCAPKFNFLPAMITRSSEVKLLVDSSFRLQDVPECILDHELVYVQPVNDELTVNQANVQLCLEILRKVPRWHLSVQLHKFINVR